MLRPIGSKITHDIKVTLLLVYWLLCSNRLHFIRLSLQTNVPALLRHHDYVFPHYLWLYNLHRVALHRVIWASVACSWHIVSCKWSVDDSVQASWWWFNIGCSRWWYSGACSWWCSCVTSWCFSCGCSCWCSGAWSFLLSWPFLLGCRSCLRLLNSWIGLK